MVSFSWVFAGVNFFYFHILLNLKQLRCNLGCFHFCVVITLNSSSQKKIWIYAISFWFLALCPTATKFLFVPHYYQYRLLLLDLKIFDCIMEFSSILHNREFPFQLRCLKVYIDQRLNDATLPRLESLIYSQCIIFINIMNCKILVLVLLISPCFYKQLKTPLWPIESNVKHSLCYLLLVHLHFIKFIL